MRRTPKILTAVAIAVVIPGAGIWWRHTRSDSKFSFRTALVKRGDVKSTINASGTIEPMEVVDVGAQVAGRIKSFGVDIKGRTVDYGSVVERGAVLANIDDSVYAADLAVARAQLEQATAGELSAAANLEQMKAKLVQAAAQGKRAEALHASKLMAQGDYDTNKANYEVARSDVSVAEAGVARAKAGVVQARAGLDKAQRNLDFCIIRSPVRGVIIDRRVNIGQTVVASLNAPSLFLIARDLTKMQIWASVNEADVGRIRAGAPVTFTCAAFPGRQFRGSVAQVRLNASMTQNIVIYTVVVSADNSDNVLLPYLTANVNFVASEQTDALLVPNAALHWSPASLAEVAPEVRSKIQADPPGDSTPDHAKKSRGAVWLKEGDSVHPVAVTIGATDGVNTVVAADELREGMEVVTGESTSGSQTAGKNPFLPTRIRW